MNDFIIKNTSSKNNKSKIDIQEFSPVEVKKKNTKKFLTTPINARVERNYKNHSQNSSEIQVKKVRKENLQQSYQENYKQEKEELEIQGIQEFQKEENIEINKSKPKYISKIRQKLNQEEMVGGIESIENSNQKEFKIVKPRVKAKLKLDKNQNINKIENKLKSLKNKHHLKSNTVLAAENRLESALKTFHPNKEAEIKMQNLSLKSINKEIKTHQHPEFTTVFEAPKIQQTNFKNKPQPKPNNQERVSIKFRQLKHQQQKNYPRQNKSQNYQTKSFIKPPEIIPSFGNIKNIENSQNQKNFTTERSLELKENSKFKPPQTPQFSTQKNSLEKQIFKSKKKQKNKFLIRITAIFLPIALILGSLAGIQSYNLLNPSNTAVAGINEVEKKESDLTPEEEAFNNWKKSFTAEELKMDEDTDKDGLANKDEFKLNTNPINPYTCDKKEKQNDLQNLLNLINPKTCEKMDLNNKKDLEIFSEIIANESVQNEILQINSSSKSNKNEKGNIKADDLKSFFGIKNYDQIDGLNQNNLEASINSYKLKKEYLDKIEKIDQYITKNRSYDIYDKDYTTPAHPAIYLETSLKHKTPLKYVLTIARLESRFGTDRFTNAGNPTRIHQHQNVFSMGLDDSGGNITFDTWEDGIHSFGRWYQYFENKGVSDCQKWRIYNPNGDYCSKVESLANEVEIYLES